MLTVLPGSTCGSIVQRRGGGDPPAVAMLVSLLDRLLGLRELPKPSKVELAFAWRGEGL